jgi:hypothetical protein
MKLVFLLFCLTPLASFGKDKISCIVEIEDVAGKVVKVSHVFGSPDSTNDRFHFKTPSKHYVCTLVVRDWTSGSMLSCDLGADRFYTFFQSDRTAVNEEPRVNKLAFRHQKDSYYLTANCTKEK